MASDFVYILSSLPMLWLSGEGAVDYRSFLEEIRGQVTPEEFGLLSRLTLLPRAVPEEGNAVLASWNHWMTVMGNVVASWRARHRKTESTLVLRPEEEAFPDDVRRLEAILQAGSISEKQDAWEQLQWERLEELGGCGRFDFPALLAYALKLQLLEGRRLRTQEAGKAVFEEMVAERLSEAAANRISVEEKNS